jgi:hypothetical protein
LPEIGMLDQRSPHHTDKLEVLDCKDQGVCKFHDYCRDPVPSMDKLNKNKITNYNINSI